MVQIMAIAAMVGKCKTQKPNGLFCFCWVWLHGGTDKYKEAVPTHGICAVWRSFLLR